MRTDPATAQHTPEPSRAFYMNSPLGTLFRHAPSRTHRKSRPRKGEVRTHKPFKKGKKQD